MIGVERLVTILRVIASSDAVLPPKSRISAILIAPSDAGKSELLLSHQPPSARVLDDFTSASLMRLCNEQPRPAWIIVPDLNAVIAHKPAVANLTMSNLLSFLGEGTTEILGPDGAKVKVTDDPAGIRYGLITGVTPEMFFQRRGKWRATGFLRRLVPIYYTYSAETQSRIQRAIREGHDGALYARAILPPIAEPAIVKIPARLAHQIQDLAERTIRYQLGWGPRLNGDGPPKERAFELPFSAHKTFRRYVRAHARLYHRLIVTPRDFAALTDFARFVRYDQPEIL